MIAAIAVVAGAIALLGVVTRQKHRQTWQEIFRLRNEIEALRGDVAGARKEAALASFRGEARLPLSMPSQNGEELLLWNFFGRKHGGFYVDVGAYDGVGSATATSSKRLAGAAC